MRGDTAGGKDRTDEFFALTESLRNGGTSLGASGVPPESNTRNRSRGPPAAGRGRDDTTHRFNEAAQALRNVVNEARSHVQDLTRLAGSTSLFNDPTQEIDNLTRLLTEQFRSLDTQLNSLKNYVKEEITSNAGARNQIGTHTTTVLQEFERSLFDLTVQYQTALKTRSKNLIAQSDKQGRYTSRKTGGNHASRPRIASSTTTGASNVTSQLRQRRPHPMSTGTEQQALLQQQQQMVPQSNDYLTSRAEEVRRIEQQINEIASMYQRMAGLIALQQDDIASIDQNIVATELNMEKAHNSLTQFYNSVQSDRWLILKVFMVLIVFAILFITLM